jgi:hypothetical protein
MTNDLAVQEETGLLEVQKLQEIVATAPEILQLNITSKTRAIEAGRKAIELAKLGMNDFNDEQLSIFMIKAKKTIDSMNERRKPFTQIVDAVKKQFTTLESELKPIMEEVKAIRDAYATMKMTAKIEADRLAQIQLSKDKEQIEIRKDFELAMATFFNQCISTRNTLIIDAFNNLTLETIESADTDLFNATTNFDKSFDIPTELKIQTSIQYTSKEEVEKIMNEVLGVNYQTKKYDYTREIASTLKEYRDKLPSKKTELEAIAKAAQEEKLRQEAIAKAAQEEKARQEAIAKAGAEEKARLEAEQRVANEQKAKLEAEQRLANEEKARLEAIAKQRIDDEAKALEAQQLAREQAAQEEAAINASAATAGAMIDASVASVTPNVKEGYSIQLKSTAGYLLLTQFWFEKEGKGLAIEKFEKVTFDRVKRFCEAYAAKNEEFIQSPLISYTPIYKAK